MLHQKFSPIAPRNLGVSICGLWTTAEREAKHFKRQTARISKHWHFNGAKRVKHSALSFLPNRPSKTDLTRIFLLSAR
jgi:hypothetical protein